MICWRPRTERGHRAPPLAGHLGCGSMGTQGPWLRPPAKAAWPKRPQAKNGRDPPLQSTRSRVSPPSQGLSFPSCVGPGCVGVWCPAAGGPVPTEGPCHEGRWGRGGWLLPGCHWVPARAGEPILAHVALSIRPEGSPPGEKSFISILPFFSFFFFFC